MENTVITKCHQIVKYEEDEKKRQLFVNEAPIYLWLVVPWLLYVLINIVISIISIIDLEKLTDTVSLGLALLNYILLLKLVSTTYSHIKAKLIKKFAQEILIPPATLSNIFAIFLAITALYFAILGLIEVFLHNEWASAEVALLTLTLYVGFTVSLEELFDKEKCPTLWYSLTKPFRQMHAGAFTIIIGIGAIIIFALLNLWEYVYWVLLALSLILFGLMVLLIVTRKRRLFIWGNNLTSTLQGKNILIYQLGTDSVVKQELEKSLAGMDVEIVDVEKEKITCPNYDIVIVLDSLNKKEKTLPNIKCLCSVTNEESVIIDPFVTKRKRRCLLAAYFGLPSAIITELSLNDYLLIIDKKAQQQ